MGRKNAKPCRFLNRGIEEKTINGYTFNRRREGVWIINACV